MKAKSNPAKRRKSPEVKVEPHEDKLIRTAIILEGQCRVGLAKGATINLGDFQSARIDVWMERVVEESDDSVEEALDFMSLMLDRRIEEESAGLK